MKKASEYFDKIVNQKLTWSSDPYNYDEYSREKRPTLSDSFGEIWVPMRCEPEDAIWGRDLSAVFDAGLSAGVRNTIAALVEAGLIDPKELQEYVETK